MPEATIASAAPRIRCSFTLQPKRFQLFQPIGGVSARPLAGRAAGFSAATPGADASAAAMRPQTAKSRVTVPPLFILCAWNDKDGVERKERPYGTWRHSPACRR